MTYLRDQTKTADALQRVWQATIATNAVDFLDRVDVIVGGLNEDQRWEDCRWQARDNITLPQRGDDCVVVMDDTGELWVTAWWRHPTVVNGRWIKGVAGEAVWTPIVAADITSPVNGQWVKGVSGVASWQPIVAADITSPVSNQFIKGVGGVSTWAPLATTDIPNISATYQARSERAAANGYASLDSSAKVPAAQLPAVAVAPSNISGYPSDRSMALRGDGAWRNTLEQIASYFDGRARVQFGQASGISVGQGDTQPVPINLASAWPTQHMMFLASIWPNSTWSGVLVRGVGLPYTLSQGQSVIDNTTTAQTFNAYYMSIGY